MPQISKRRLASKQQNSTPAIYQNPKEAAPLKVKIQEKVHHQTKDQTEVAAVNQTKR